ncbi:MAG TPA: D-Ala-D-Ala carboxypeptidase family metallohydrolase [Planctomycetota bacterium]|nr:D-Ala-D-Ala carboxypeptidase family metallohydrolase [Planctomycetota bacterium]
MVLLEQRLPGVFRAFFERIDAALAGLNVTVTSWWRDQQTNADVGGAQLSQHLLGLALDMVGPDQAAAAKRLREAGLIVLEHSVPGGRLHLHVQAFPAGFLKLVFG